MGSGKKIKVLFLTNIPSPYRNDFFNELGKKCDLTVLYEKKTADDREWKVKNNETYNAIFMNGIKFGPDTALCFEVLKFFKNKFDIIIVGGYSTPTAMLAIIYLYLKRIKFIINCDGGMIKNENKIRYIIKKFFIIKATSWLSTGIKTNEYLEHYGAISEKIFTYPFTSIKEKEVLKRPLDKKQKENLRKKAGIKSSKIIISVGQFIDRKGFDLLIKVAKYFPDVAFFLIGGKAKKEYLALVELYNLKNVFFFEFMEKKELYLYYKFSDLMVFPTREDIWGLVINEAMANGLPIISTNKCNAAIELVNNNGFIVNENNIDELKNAINAVIYNDILLEKMSNSSCEIIKNYTIEQMAEKHIEIFLKILE